MPGPFEQAGRRHCTVTVPAHEDHAAAWQLRGVMGKVTELEMHSAGNVPGAVLRALPDVENGAVIELLGTDEAGGCDGAAVGDPCGDAAVEPSGKTLVADLERRPYDVRGALARAEDEDQRRVRREQPAQPGRERVTQRNGYRAGDVRGRVLPRRADVDEDGAVIEQAAQLGRLQGGEAGLGVDSGRAAPVDLGEPLEVHRVGAQTVSQLSNEGVLVGGCEQRVGALLCADGGGALSSGRRRAERARAVGGPYPGLVGEGGEPPERPELRAG